MKICEEIKMQLLELEIHLNENHELLTFMSDNFKNNHEVEISTLAYTILLKHMCDECLKMMQLLENILAEKD